MRTLRSAAHVALVIGSFLSSKTSQAQVTHTARSRVSADELAVYAAVINLTEKLGESSRPLIADTTSTFECGTSSCNGLSIGGCNGLRTSGESPSQRMAIVKRDLRQLQESTAKEFLASNQKCVSIQTEIPTVANYYWFTSLDIPKEWKYSYLVYFSRPGFNADHTQALLNVGLFSASNAADSAGKYVLLTKETGKWVINGTSAIWELGMK